LHLSRLRFEIAIKLRRSVDLSPDVEEFLGELLEMDEDAIVDLHVAEDPHPLQVSNDFKVDFNLFDEFLKDYANFDV
jgi:cytosine/adenosine deaminase-related metal-dependent hydrolase